MRAAPYFLKLMLALALLLPVQPVLAADEGVVRSFKVNTEQLREMVSSLAATREELFSMDTGGLLSAEDIDDLFNEFSGYMTEYIFASMEVLPEKYWQYVVPGFYVTPFIPQEVLDYQPFLAYKGKKPTVIDPKWQKFADKHLDNLHPALYFILMPQKIPGEEEGSKSLRNSIWDYSAKLPKQFPPQVFLEDQPRSKVIDAAFAREPAEKYASGEYLKEKPDTERAKDITADSRLRGGDVLAFLQTVPDIVLLAKKDQEMKMGSQGNVKGMLDQMLISVMELPPACPCEHFVSSLEKEMVPVLETLVGEQGFTKKSWGYVCDQTIKAYRLYSLTSSQASGILDTLLRKPAIMAESGLSERGKKMLLDSISDTENRYSGKPEDMQAVKWYMDEISRVFSENDFMLYMKTDL